jgi:hypothetical protein
MSLIDTQVETYLIRPLTRDERDLAVCELYKAGNDVVECGRPFRIGRERVYQILRKHGVTMRKGVAIAEPTDEVEPPVRLDRFTAEVIKSRSKRKFQALGDEAKAVVRKAFNRHLRACESLDCPVDIQFLPDAVYEAGRMAKLREQVTVNS